MLRQPAHKQTAICITSMARGHEIFCRVARFFTVQMVNTQFAFPFYTPNQIILAPKTLVSIWPKCFVENFSMLVKHSRLTSGGVSFMMLNHIPMIRHTRSSAPPFISSASSSAPKVMSITESTPTASRYFNAAIYFANHPSLFAIARFISPGWCSHFFRNLYDSLFCKLVAFANSHRVFAFQICREYFFITFILIHVVILTKVRWQCNMGKSNDDYTDFRPGKADILTPDEYAELEQITDTEHLH